jgi:hypothetical protein
MARRDEGGEVPTNRIPHFRPLGLGVLALLAAAAVVAVCAASVFAAVHELFSVEAKTHARGKLTRTVDGVRFSLIVPKTGWENGPLERIGRIGNDPKFRTHSLLISKSTSGGQAAEAVIFWAGFGAGGRLDRAPRCLASLRP